jgi:hypothetical protein
MRPYVSAFMVLAMCSLAGSAMSQQAHQHPQSPVIDGSVHPELIPDLTAYRLGSYPCLAGQIRLTPK